MVKMLPTFRWVLGVLFAAVLLLGSALGLSTPVLAAPAKTASTFDHMTTGFPLTGQHTHVRCEDCHVKGIFKGLPPQCAACHTPGALVNAVMIPNKHIPVVQPCDTCHNTSSFYGTHFVHSDVKPGTCAQCHNGVFAKGTNTGHISINAASCDSCHSTVSFATAYMVPPPGHIPTTQACLSCHTNSDFTPPTPGNQNLAPHMNHSGTAGLCNTCHVASATPKSFSIPGTLQINGALVSITQSGQPVVVTPMSQSGFSAPGVAGALNHVPATASCDACHTNGNFTQGSAFKNAVMHHAAVAGTTCGACHNVSTVFAGTGVGSGGQPYQIPGPVGTPGPNNHMPVGSLDCASSGCHLATDTVTSNGTAFATGVTPALNAAGHQAVNLPCQSCHGVGMTWRLTNPGSLINIADSHIAFTASTSCVTCHSNASSYATGAFAMSNKGLFGASAVLSSALHAYVSTSCNNCHEASSANLGFQGIGSNIYLRPNTSVSGKSLPSGLDPLHSTGTLATGSCASCHTTTGPFSAGLVVPGGHIPVNTGAACTDCHAVGYTPATTHMLHADVTNTPCATCHNSSSAYLGSGQGLGGGQPWQMNGAVGTAGGASKTHFPIGSAGCSSSGCHSSSAAVLDVMTATGVGFYIGSTNPVLNSAGHATVSSLSCTSCHAFSLSGNVNGNLGSDSVWKGVADLEGANTSHIPIGSAACTTCHSSASNYAVAGFVLSGKGLQGAAGNGNSGAMTVAMHAAVASAASCNTCHEAGQTSFEGIGSNIFLRPNNGSGSGWSASGDALHPSGSGDCGTCHTTTPTFLSDVKSVPTNHIAFNTGAACADCHAAGYGQGKTVMKHADVTNTTCATCHNAASGTSFAGSSQGAGGQPWQMNGAVGTAGGTSTTHFPIAGVSCSSGGCHAAVDTMNPDGSGFRVSSTNPVLSATGHASVSSASCGSCHYIATGNVNAGSGNSALWKGVADMEGSTSVHIPGGNSATSTVACVTCHTNATNFGLAGFVLSGKGLKGTTGNGNSGAMTVAMHAAVASVASGCNSCHEAGQTGFQGVGSNIFLRPNNGAGSGWSTASGDTLHPSGSGDCASCHSTTPTFLSNVSSIPSNHIALNTGAACTDCHAAGYGQGKTVMKHADVTNTACATCHNAASTTSFAGASQGAGGQPWQMNGTVGTAGGTSTTHFPIGSATCSSGGCHTAVDAMTTTGAGFLVSSTNPVLSSTGHATVSSLSCASCHYIASATTSSGSGSAAVWKGVADMEGSTSAHIPGGNNATGTVACTTCHTAATGYAVGNFVLANKGQYGVAGNASSSAMTVAMHTAVASVASGCNTCHESGLTSFQGVGSNIFLRPNNGAGSGWSTGSGDTAHPTGTGDCGGCHTTTPTFLSNAKALPTNHIPINTGAACADCHAAGYGSGKSIMVHADVTNTPCATCHNSSTTYAGTSQGLAGQPWQMNGAVGTAGGTSTTHFPIGSATCNSSGCHTPTNAVMDKMNNNGAGFLVSSTNPVLSATGHAAVSSATCASCHYIATATTSSGSGSNAVWKGVADMEGSTSVHIPGGNSATSTVACASCHTGATAYTVGSFVLANKGLTGTSTVMTVAMHTTAAAAVSGCNACHESSNANLAFQGVGANIYLRPNLSPEGLSSANDSSHPSATGNPDCGGCHTTTPTFASNAQALPTGHIAIVSGTACSVCHTTGVFSTVVQPMPHTGYVSGTCASCHNNSTKFAGSTFTPNATGGGGTYAPSTPPTALNFAAKQIVASPAVGSSGGHIPLPSGDDCSTCHAVPTAALNAFGPATAMNHSGITSNCAQCHTAGAVWYGESYVASILIKNGGTAIGSPVHVPILNATGGNADCSVCHSTTVFTNFGTTAKVNHTSTFLTITGSGKSQVSAPSCKSCHGPSGQKWYGISLSTETVGSHQGSTTSQDCIDCHSVNNFAAAAAAAVAHRPVVHASAGPAVHPGLLPTSSLPSTPLLGRRFVAGAPFDHMGVVPGTCVSCHSPLGGATPMPSGHLPTTQSCDTCHRTTAWLPAVYLHAGVAPGTCATCHTGNWATAKPSTHMLTTRTCDTCHTTTTWLPPTYTHADLIYTPHAATVTCIQCHKSNTEQVVWTYPNLKPGCGGCHGPQFVVPLSRQAARVVTPRR